MDVSHSNPAGVETADQSQVSLGPVSSWVKPCEYDAAYKGRAGAPVTQLLLSIQAHAESAATWNHSVRRLETTEAARRTTDWRIDLPPPGGRLVLHWLRVRRNGRDTDFARPERLRIVEADDSAGTVRSVVLPLDDLRTGDSIDVAYTVEFRNPVLPRRFPVFFAVPDSMPTGRYQFRLLASNTRRYATQQSTAAPARTEGNADGLVTYEWQGEAADGFEPEAGTPAWQTPAIWVQASDFQGWQEIATTIASAWTPNSPEPALLELAESIRARHSEISTRIDEAIRFVQDDCQHPGTPRELAAVALAPLTTVLERRSGNDAELAVLLTRLLQALGVEARTILVSAHRRSAIGDFLPSASQFDHAVVEFTAEGRTRWIDPSLKRQGGGAFRRAVPPFGLGLPIDLATTDLQPAPAEDFDANLDMIQESILLDTTGRPSYLAVVVQARGSTADDYRRRFESDGPERIAEERLQYFSQRYKSARRANPMQYRDNRDAGTFEIAEVYQIEGFLFSGPRQGLTSFVAPESQALDLLRFHQKSPRRQALSLPFPRRVTHTIEIESPSLQPSSRPRLEISSPCFAFAKREKSLHRSWSSTTTLTFLRDSVPPDLFSEHEKLVARILKEAPVTIPLPIGVDAPFRRRDFGDLPPPPGPAAERMQTSKSPLVPALPLVPPPAVPAEEMHPLPPLAETPAAPSSPAPAPKPEAGPMPTPSPAPDSVPEERPRRQHRPKPVNGTEIFLWCVIVACIVGIGLIIYFRGGSR